MHLKHILLGVLIFSSAWLMSQNFEGFETGNFLAYNWQFAGQANWTTTINNPYQGSFCAQTGAVEANQYSKLSITLEVVTPSELSFWWKTDSETEGDRLIFYLDGSETASISGNTIWQQYSINVQTGYHTFAWSYEKDAQVSWGADAGWLDSITFPITTTFDHDLAIQSIQGPSALFQGFSGVYDIQVKNYGTNLENDYTVNLYREGGILLDQLNITEPIDSEEEIIHHLVWIVPHDEPAAITYVYAELIVAEDDDLSNNISADYDVTIYEYGLAQINIGSGSDLTNWYPFKFHMNASLAETIYMSNEIGVAGDIYAISYKSNFSETVFNAPIQVYLAETTQSNLSGGWITAGSMDLVFDDNIDFYTGIHDVVIPFDLPFSYSGNNLCVLTHHVYMSNTFSIDNKFYETITTQYHNRTRAVGSGNPLSPNSPPAGYLFSRYPNITLYMMMTNLGIVEGHVYDDMGNTISTATISIDQSNTNTYSNGSGYYQFGNVIEGNYDFTAFKPGYQPTTINATVLTGETTSIDFTLNSLPTIEVSGHVVGSIDPATSLVNAVVSLIGNVSYQTQTDENGIFFFPAVFGNETYELNITYSGYQPHVQQIDVQTTNIDLGTIILDEVAIPASNVQATQNLAGTELTLIWNAPGSAGRDLESYTIYRFFSINYNDPNFWIELENAHPDTIYIDENWSSLEPQTYQYAVVANYTNGVISEAALSNEIDKMAVGADDLIPHSGNKLLSIYPNPFNPATRISYQLAEDSDVEISVFNMRGQKISTLLNREEEKGFHHIIWDGKDADEKKQSSAMYFIRLQVDGKIADVKKCILIK